LLARSLFERIFTRGAGSSDRSVGVPYSIRSPHLRGYLFVAIVAVGLLTSSGRSQAQSDGRGFGLGLIIGDPTGVTMKGFLTQDTAIDGAVGFGLLGGEDLHVHADFLWHFEVQRWDSAALALYLGVGPELGLHFHDDHGPDDHGHDHVHIGARGPFGLAVMFDAPFDVFLEVAAGLWLVDKVGFHLDAAIGGRYWF
jgi:hypothetical protein